MWIDDLGPVRDSAVELAADGVLTRAQIDAVVAYRAAYPPAADQAMVPACMIRFYGRPQHRTFREDVPSEPA